jgi:hypothetical protein
MPSAWPRRNTANYGPLFFSLLSCASDSRSPDHPTSSSIHNARNPSRLPANPYVHPFSLPSDTSSRIASQPRFKHMQRWTRRSTRPCSSNPLLLASSNSRDATLVYFLHLPLFGLKRRLTIYVTIQFAKTSRKDKGVPY